MRDGAYRRSLALPHGPGIVELTPRAGHVACRLLLGDPLDVELAVARCRRLLDLDADPVPIDEHLARDPALSALVARGPGRRVPGTVDGAELTIRAVLGQQISTAAARTLAGRLAAAHGRPVTDPSGGLTRLFPTAGSLLRLRLPGPASRARTLAALVTALVAGDLPVDPSADTAGSQATSSATARTALGRLPGIGPWTTEIVLMRGLGDPDAFPASDLGVRRAAEALGLPAAPAALREYSLRWSPWRAYAVQYLWSVLPHAINDWPPRSRTTVISSR